MVGSSTSTKSGTALRLLALGALLHAGMPAGAGELRLDIEGEAGVRNDGNYAQTAQTAQTAQSGLVAGSEEDRNIARGGVSFRLSYDMPRSDLALIYTPSYEENLDDSEVSGTTHRLDLGFQGELTRRLRLRVRERLLKSPNLDLYAPLSVAEPIAVTRRGDQLSHGLDVSFEHDLTRRAMLVVGAQHSLRTFEDSELSDNLYDTETLGGTLGASFSLAEDRQIGVSAGAGQFDYERRGEADVQNVGVSYSQRWGRSGRFAVEAGIFSVESTLLRHAVIALPDGALDEAPGPPVVEDVLVKESDDGWRGALSLSRQGRFFGWNLGYRHDVSAGFGLGEPTEADSAFAGVSYSPTRRLTFGLDGNAARHEPLGDSQPDVVLPSAEARSGEPLNEFAAGTARLSWTFFQGLRLTGGYSRIWQSSRVEPFEDLSYDRFFLGLAFRIWSSGETPREPDLQGEPIDEADDPQEPDAR